MMPGTFDLIRKRSDALAEEISGLREFVKKTQREAERVRAEQVALQGSLRKIAQADAAAGEALRKGDAPPVRQ